MSTTELTILIYTLSIDKKDEQQKVEKRGDEKVLIGLEWLPVVKGWALQSQKSQSLCEFQANPAFGTNDV
jgi:hypothetical protein